MTAFRTRPVTDSGGLWAITTYFNPRRYRSKLANYRLFRAHLNLPLLAIELAYGPHHELDKKDADILVRRRGHDVLWQKERLLNSALQALPDDCRNVVWVDCDVVFEAKDWPRRTNEMLDHFRLVQPFRQVHRMPAAWVPGEVKPSMTEQLNSVPFLIASGMPIETCLGTPASQIQCTPGYAWAANRSLLENFQFYDACVVGGGDSAMARAAYGRFDDALRLQHLHRDHYLAWAVPFHDAVRSKVTFLDGDLLHLWHGKTEHRRYRERNEALARFAFNPMVDVAVDQEGAWRWNSGKSELHAFVNEYFELRREDE
jgi:hypothetical protein